MLCLSSGWIRLNKTLNFFHIVNRTGLTSRLKKIGNLIFGTRAAGFYMLFFGAVIGLATFIENDFGTSAAQKVIFKSWWFELLLILFSICLIYNIRKFKMIGQKKWSLLIFHLAMIIIIIGAGITRYFGYEGMMHIREGDQTDMFLSADTYLNFDLIKGNDRYQWSEPVLFASLGANEFEESYQVGNDIIKAKLIDFIPNPIQILEEDENGEPILKLVIGGSDGREEYFLSPGERRLIRGVKYNFTDTFIDDAVNLKYEDKGLFIRSSSTLFQTVMATQKRDTLSPREDYYPLRLRSLYSDGKNNFVFGDFIPQGKVVLNSENRKVKNESLTCLRMDIEVNGSKTNRNIYGRKGMQGRQAVIKDENLSLALSYGSKPMQLPFSLKLYDFQMERYPGTNSAASYASEVQLIDPEFNVNRDFRIYMNNILNYRGFRFFQSSFDQDELGTYLSVNHDFWGTWISYIGYALLTIGMLMIFVSRRTRFYKVSQKIGGLKTVFFIFASLSFSDLIAQKQIDPIVNSIDKQHAQLFSEIIVQDFKGRMKPMHTLSREILRKVSRKERIYGLSADQIILSMYADKTSWLSRPLIKVSSQDKLNKLIGSSGELIPYKDFFTKEGRYKLQEEVRRAYGLQPIDRGQFEKDIMKIDERINLVSMVFSGALFKVIPLENSENNEWVGAVTHHGNQIQNATVADRFFSNYKLALSESLNSKDYKLPNQIIQELGLYQAKIGSQVIPGDKQIKAEIFLNNLNVFNKLSAYYSILGMVYLILLFTTVFKPGININKISKVIWILLLVGFFLHTLGLGLRWYVSERAPWSNGYESMIYIAWTSTLAGIIFTRKSLGGLAATMILAGTILLVAMLSYLDPEITPLVPVLRSYWLTIHVSLIAGSYGFLMLGAIIGIINLVLMIFLKSANIKRVITIIQEMTNISELTITGGLVMISIGTYLGGVWANESWGRYWGWDAKETWALVTILVYAFILHMRLIPKMYSLFSFNLATLFGFASVVMTYFGVNYYLSGLHSYAAGDPVPIPTWVYIATVSVIIVSIMAFLKKKRMGFS